ncbi:hypothetical protein BGZ83_001873 [Gryganskiella cystojenkinii]|nr:hypothetical protein BGZ83_001873 [Gryganskiella cystojenkinii]
MKISTTTLLVLSLGLSLLVVGEGHRDKHDHNDAKAVKEQPNHHHHRQQQEANAHGSKKVQSKEHKSHHHHHDAAHHIGQAAIPHVPYRGDKGSDTAPPPSVIASEPDRDDINEAEDTTKKTKHGKGRDSTPKVADPRGGSQKEKMVVAYWTDWTSGAMPPEAIPFDKVTHVNYAFSIVRPDFKPVFETDYLLKRVVKSAHANNVKVLMSIGGWTGSQYFSPLAASKQSRKVFIDGAIDMIRQNNLDGIDIDWEYPGRLGSACNTFDEKNDAKNFLKLLQELRAAMDVLPNGADLQISLATRIVPFDGPEGIMKDVSDFSKVVNHINVMAYDINGSWGTVTGANAPLEGDGLTYSGGAEAWIQAGFPPEQINMGVPFYGRSLITKRDMTASQIMAAPFDKKVPIGDNNDGLWTDPCEKTAAYSGVWKYKNLREQGVIDGNGQARAPWIRKFDEESQTPWLFNPETNQFISYDDRESLRLKVEFAKQKNLGGVMLWAINQDTTDFELLNVLQEMRN